MMNEKKKAGILNASERDGVDYRRAPILQLIAGLANNGTGVIFYLILGFATLIAPEGYGIPTILAGMILTVTRWADGVSDMVVAAIFERINPRKGKIRIMLIAGWAVAALASMLMYSWAAGKFDGILGIVVFVAVYLLFDIGNTINGVAGGTVGIVITTDPTQRSMTGLLSTLYSYCVPMICTNVITFVILPKHNMKYDIPMLGETMSWFAVLSFIFVMICCWGVRKVDVRETFAAIPKNQNKKAEEKVTIKEMWSVLKDNRNVQMYMLRGISDKLAQQTMSQSVVTTLMSGVLIGSYAASQIAGNWSQIVGIAFALFGGVLVAKYGGKKVTNQWSWICIIAVGLTVALCVVLCFSEGSVDGMKQLGTMGLPFVIYVILTIVRTGGAMVLQTAGTAMRADITDYEYDRSGNYMPAIVSGVYSLVDKIVSSFGSTIAMLGIAAVGYTSTVPQIGDKATWPMFWMAMFLQFGLLIIGWICNVIAMKFYTLDKEKMIEIQKSLNQKREEAGLK